MAGTVQAPARWLPEDMDHCILGGGFLGPQGGCTAPKVFPRDGFKDAFSPSLCFKNWGKTRVTLNLPF